MFGIYIHWPFCVSKCPYCDFNSHVRSNVREEVWADALIQDLESFVPLTANRKVTSVFFGGGTPSLMSSSTVQRILHFIQTTWSIDASTEITLEANPTSIENKKFARFREAGINRLSLSIQSLREEALQFLGHPHTVQDGKKAIQIAASHFSRYSFDLIYGRPNQTIKAWEEELEEALEYTQGHLSLYQLTIEEGTPFYLAYHRKDFDMPSEELEAQFYEHTSHIMNHAGFNRYEVSNYAQPAHECLHNITYWTYQDYIGVGPGAHSRLTSQDVKYSLRRHRSPEVWLQHVQAIGNGTYRIAPLPHKDRIEEYTMMGLRLKEGIRRSDFKSQAGHDFLDLFSSFKLKALEEEKLLYISPHAVALTSQGLMKLDSVLKYLLPCTLPQ